MRGVTVGAYGGDSQASFVKSFAVHTLGIVGQDTVLGNIKCPGNLRALLVAASAHIGDIEFCHSRIGGRVRQNVMRSMTVPASRGKTQSFFYSDSVEAGIVFSGDIIMAGAAIYGLRLFVMREIGAGQIGMAIYALEIRVNRIPEFLEIDKYRDCPAIAFAG